MAIGNPITLTSNVASKTISVIATAGQTLFTVTGGYRINQLAVFRNGVRLLDGRDYEARNGSTVTLLSAATVGDALEFQVFDDFRVADAIVSAESEQTIQGNLTVAGILTATDLSVTDLSLRHLKATGISTVSDTTQATSTTTGAFIVSGGVGIAKSLFVGGDMSVAGTLTYEDVTNTETAGITTTGGLVVTGLGATFGSGVGIADSIYHIDDSNTAIRFPAADTFTVTTAGNERLRITSDGDVGIGTEAPETPRGNRGLEVAGTTGAEIVATRFDDNLVDGDFIGGFVFKNLDAGGTPNHFAGMYAKANGTAGAMDLHFTGDRAQYEADTSDLTIRSGLVGIGTQIPGTALEVFGSGAVANVKAEGQTNARVRIEAGNTSSSYLEFGDSDDSDVGEIVYDHSTNAMRFRTNGSPHVYITSAGDVGIGTDTPTSFGPTLQVAGTDPALLLQDTATAVDYFGVNVTSGITQLWYDDAAALTINTASGISGSGLVERLRIDSSGQLIHTGLRAGGGENKLAILSTLSHNTNEEKVAVYIAENESSFNQLTFGGGSSSYNAVTTLRFMTASAVDTTTGTERLRITSAGTLFSFSPDDTTPNFKWRSDDTNWHGALNISVEGGSIASFWSTGGDWSVDDTTYSCTKNLAAYPSAAIALHNQYSSSFESKLVFLNKAGGSTTTDGAITELASISSAGVISDAKGDLRKIIHKQESSAYTLVAADAGKAIEIQGNLTVPNSVFAAGDAITIINDSSSDKTISKGTGLTYMFNTADGTNANRTLGGRGMATIYFVNSTTCYISGSQLS